jgi:uncharacterized repeat protein (TIGR01451 family)
MRAAGRHIDRKRLLAIGLGWMLFIVGVTGVEPAYGSAAWWQLASSARPAILPAGGEGTVVVTAENLGDSPATGEALPVVVSDALPAGVTAVEASGSVGEPLFSPPVACTLLPTVSCKLEHDLQPYEALDIKIKVKIEPGAKFGEVNEATVSGGGAPSASVKRPLAIGGSPTPFGLEDYKLALEEEGGARDTQAGSHPFQFTTSIALNQNADPLKPPALPKDLHVELPPGLIGDPEAVPRCTDLEFNTRTVGSSNLCPADTAVGVVSVTFDEPKFVGLDTAPVPLFNLTPSHGEPARLGFEFVGNFVIFDTSVRTGGDYGVTVDVKNVPEAATLLSSRVTVWGAPGDFRHDPSRGWNCIDEPGGPSCVALNETNPTAFLTLPTSCTGELRSSASADSWLNPGTFMPAPAGEPFEALDGCNRLPFDPSISLVPETHAASTPTGVDVDVHLPQETTLSPKGYAEADLKNTTVTLPAGMQVNPAAADGLEACSEAQIALKDDSEPSCPDASKVGTVEIDTPLLANPLTGGVYLAAQNANPFGSLVALYLVAESPVSGLRVKLAGEVHLDEHTGQVVTTFKETPQLTFEDVKMHFFDGPRAALATPDECGTYTTSASFDPWSGNPAARPSSSFAITSGPHGSPCPDPLPFAPSLTAGALSIQAGAFSPFATTVSREDGNQNLSAIQLHLPVGLLGRLASVTPCSEPQASLGACGPESLIGHTVVSVGLGSDPYTVNGGRVFITGPYKGAPYGLSVVVPAKAGPYDLGTVVVRAKIEVDPHTSALTVTTDPLPTMLKGIPLQIKHVSATIDRPGFTFNPTNCSVLQIKGTLSGEQGGTSSPSVPFQVANCATLPFKPSFRASTQAKTSKAAGASLNVRVASGPGQANIAKTRIVFPKQLPARLTTLQKACTDTVFNSNPSACPAASAIGSAIARTPVLKNPLTGPVYLVSHGGVAFPDAVIVLQGEGVTLYLDGNTNIKKGITSSTFNSVPDAPITSFEVTLPEGPHSAFATNIPAKAKGSMCGQSLKMPTVLTGQNGAVLTRTTKIAVTGCLKKKAKKASHHGKGKATKKR